MTIIDNRRQTGELIRIDYVGLSRRLNTKALRFFGESEIRGHQWVYRPLVQRGRYLTACGDYFIRPKSVAIINNKGECTMPETNLHALRTTVRKCLKEYGMNNPIQLSKVGFNGRAMGRIITIKDWNATQNGKDWASLKRTIQENIQPIYDKLPGWILLVETDWFVQRA